MLEEVEVDVYVGTVPVGADLADALGHVSQEAVVEVLKFGKKVVYGHAERSA
jgi:hypothetical protein